MRYKTPTKKAFDYIETGITTQNGVVPYIFGQEICSGKKSGITYAKSCYTLHVIISGKGYVDKKSVSAQSVFLLYPNSKSTYHPDSDDPWTYLWIEFDGYLVENYLKHCGFTEENPILPISDETLEKILKYFGKIFLDVPRNFNKHSRTILYESHTMEIFASIIEECGYLERNKEKSFQQINVENIINFINNNYSNPKLNVSYIASQFSYAPSYLTRLFKKYTNISPCKYVTQVRMKKAVELFRKNILSINKVSAIVGYQNQFYFSKAFYEYFGVRPTQYLSDLSKE